MKSISHKKQKVVPGQVTQLGRQVEQAYRSGQLEVAKGLCRSILTLSPGNPEALYLLARIALDMNRLAEAELHIAEALKQGRSDPRVWLLKGNLAARSGRFDEARQAFLKVTRLAAMEPLGWLNLAKVLLELNEIAEAGKVAKTATLLSPGNPEARNVLAQALLEQKNYHDAEAILAPLVSRHPGYGDALKNLGAAYVLQGKFEQAKALVEGINLSNADPESLKALVGILRRSGELDLADRVVVYACKAYPDDLSWKTGYSDFAFSRGLFEEGWAYYEAKEANGPVNRWGAGELEGKRVCVYTDQGLGDDVFFWRYLPALHERGARVCYQVSHKLLEMARRLPCVDEVRERENGDPDCDLSIPISSLPFLSGQGLVPGYAEACRVAPLQEKIDAVRLMLREAGTGPYLGLTLRGGRPLREVSGLRKLQIYSKSIALEDVSGILRDWPGQIVWLQFKPLPGEVEEVSRACGKQVLDMSAFNDDLESMLALLDELDEYLTVSNTNVHLRAMLGKASRVLVPLPPEFRWGREGNESVWFPGTSVYRQLPGGSWDEALAELGQALKRH